MQVLILCAGNTARTPLGTDRAQPALLTVKGKPVIEHILNKIQLLDSVAGVTILANESHYPKFLEWAADYNFPLPLTILHNEKKNAKDSRGACAEVLYAVDKQSIDEDLLVIGGDNLFSFTLNDFVDFAGRRWDTVTAGVYSLNGELKPKIYGLLKLDEQNHIVDFCEKPQALNGLRWVSICVYYFPKDKLKALSGYVSQNPQANGLGTYLEWLVKQQTVSGFAFEGDWFDVSDEEAYSEAVFSF